MMNKSRQCVLQSKKQELLKKVALAAIGPVTSETLKKHGLKPAIEADKYTIDGLVQAIRQYYNK